MQVMLGVSLRARWDATIVYKLVGQGGLSKKTIGGQKERRSKKIQRNKSESGIKCVCLNVGA